MDHTGQYCSATSFHSSSFHRRRELHKVQSILRYPLQRDIVVHGLPEIGFFCWSLFINQRNPSDRVQLVILTGRVPPRTRILLSRDCVVT